MIKTTATAVTIRSISPVIQVTDTFQKRELVVEDSFTKQDGQVFTSPYVFEFTGEKMAILDQFQVGQRVNVEGYGRGREGRDGKVFVSTKGHSVTLFQPYQQPVQQPQPQYQQPQYQQYPPQGYQQQPQYPQQAFGQYPAQNNQQF